MLILWSRSKTIDLWYLGYYWAGGNITQCPSPGHNNKTGSTSNIDWVACSTGEYANIQGIECYSWETYKYIVDENSADWSGVCGAGNYISTNHDGKTSMN